MIKLNSKNIQPSSVNHLDKIQQEIDNEPTFEAQVKKANSKWNNKSYGAGKDAFKDIKDVLTQMSVGVELCVYCEQNEATDIEHIFPKKLYPEKAFKTSNYVLACSKCNSHYKSDKFSIFNPINSKIEEDVTPARGTYVKPANSDALFINQLVDDPMDLLELDFVIDQFCFTERYPVGTREHKKAEYTIRILGLNTRANLISSRRSATNFYYSRLEQYVKAKSTINFHELGNAINDVGYIDQTLDFSSVKYKVLEAIKNDIVTYSHPTVWKELLRQRQSLPKTNALLDQAPEVLNW